MSHPKRRRQEVINTNKKSDFDFTSLLTYCSEEEKEKFSLGLKEHPISSLLLANEGIKEELLNTFPGLQNDKEDSLLYRFDKEEDRVGKSVEHFGGGFYILDPSSALISLYLAPLLKKDFVSLDLCGAPGGKTIALDLRRRDGFYLCNDISYPRADEIRKNAERLGLDNLLSLSVDPMKFALEECFDSVILDAPCSGSGMIRKEPKMALDYSKEKVERLLPIQETLFETAYSLLAKGGYLAYSTCSLSTEEDERQVEKFLSHHPDMEETKIPLKEGYVGGENGHGIHLLPGVYQGEGIYFTILKKKDGRSNSLHELALAEGKEDGSLRFRYRKNEYIVSKMYEEFTSLPFVAPGLKVYDSSEHPKCSFDHAFSKVSSSLPLLPLTREEAISYASGNEVKSQGEDGLVILTFSGLRLGLGKRTSGKIKNYLPKGLRASLL